jgi:hypothetical protein
MIEEILLKQARDINRNKSRLEEIETIEEPAIFTSQRTVTGSDIATSFDGTIFVNSPGTPRTITLPTAVGIGGRIFVIKDIGGNAAANNITVQSPLGQTIDGAGSQPINTNYGSLIVQSDGANWFVIANR